MKNTRNKNDGSFQEKSPTTFCDITSLIQSPCCTIMESISDGVFTIDREKRITSFNRAAECITGLSRQKAVGQFCFDVFRADICAKNCALEKTLLNETPQIDISARIIAAANLALKERVANGEFREDLFYRLNVVTLELPPLWERREDIPLLADRFIEKLNLSKGKNIREIAPDALQALMQYWFPGNVRELENAIEYAFITCKGSVIRNAHLPPEIAREKGPAAPRLSEEQHMEAEKICTFLKQHANSREKTAKALGISRSTLWRKMKKLGITPPESET